MDDYAGRVLADRYRLPLPPSDEYELTETRAFDTYSGQEVLIRQVPLPEVVEAEVLDADGLPDGFTARDGGSRHAGGRSAAARQGSRKPADPVVRRAVEAAQAAAAVPDHPRLDQVFDVFAEGGSLWIVSELVAARPLAALLAEQPLTPYRAAEVASDILLALRVLHTYGWVHRNITARTVLVCDDGRVMLTGLAVGAAEEALCGYDPVPAPDDGEGGSAAVAPDGTFGRGGGAETGGLGPGGAGAADALVPGARDAAGPRATGVGPQGAQSGSYGTGGTDPEAARRAAIEARDVGGLPVPQGPGGAASGLAPAPPATSGDVRAARAGAIAAYRAGARAAARVQEGRNGRAALTGARPAAGNGPDRPPHAVGAGTGTEPGARTEADRGRPSHAPDGSHPVDRDAGPGPHTSGPHPAAPRPADTVQAAPPGQITDPYGVGATSWHGATARPTGDPAAAPRAAGHALPAAPQQDTGPAHGQWDDLVIGTSAQRGPATALAAERARQTRMAVVGPVTERWAPEQAGPVHENWQLAAPIGPATDLWALGALLFRAVQGHAPYPEEATAELVQIVCAEPPAFAEECGPLRPVVESLLRQDPTERIDFEELRGWLRSLVRSAPEPEAGLHVVSAPPAETSRLPIVRRRGELVRKRRAGLPAHQGRHKRDRRETARSPRSLGRTLLLLILLALAGAIAYAVLFMPKSDTSGAGATDRTGAAGGASQAPPEQSPDGGSEPRPEETPPKSDPGPSRTESGSTETQSNDPAVADGFTLRKDAEGFRVAVAEGWDRTPRNGSGQVVYSKGDFELIVVPGRDRASEFGDDPMAYQRDTEPELASYRASSWATSSGLRTIEVGGRTMVEGQFTWTGADGELYVRNLAMLVDGRYHVVQVRGPAAERDEVTRLFEQASSSYQYTG
ncbi:protein kinase [Streptomyces mutabilis]|uniref:protein kinase n=1 Tax=Streptomyces mutabilis TaxID=67332 RepID=UPI00177B5A62|nr:protein kinase [Streptomyces mutabilis]GGQ06022.1 serine/threonine protein kinase [Streptomyces mutabilis]